MRAIDPIFVKPRLVQHDWGRNDPGGWWKGAIGGAGPTGEAWVHDAANRTDSGPLGRRLAANIAGMLGDLGRAPPRLRLVFPNQNVTLKSTAPVSFWTIVEPGDGLPEADHASHRTGARIRAYEGAEIALAAGCVALEVSAAFQPNNEGDGEPSLICLPPVSNRIRATLFREASLSVETWSLPERSRLVPDGETCHVLTPLTPGVVIDGRRLPPGEAVFLPAWGRAVDVTASRVGVKALVAYPDRTPTAVWRHTSSPDPMGGLLPKPEPGRTFVHAVSQAAEPALAA